MMKAFPEIEIAWQRPVEIPYPNAWHRFETISPKNGKSVKVRIEDLAEDRIDEAVEFMMKNFVADEPLRRAVKFSEDEVSVMSQKEAFARIMAKRMTLVAVIDEDFENPQILAAQVYSVVSKQDPPLPPLPGKAREKMARIFSTLQGNFNPLEYFHTDAYLYDWGLCVAPEFRGLGVGFHLMNTIKLLAKAVKIGVVVIRCNSIQAQILAERVGCKLYRELRYSDCKDDNGEILCPVEGTQTIKLTALTL